MPGTRPCSCGEARCNFTGLSNGPCYGEILHGGKHHCEGHDEHGQWRPRITTPFDDEAMCRYLNTLAMRPEDRTRLEAAFLKALDEGYRLKDCVRIALGEP